MGMRTHGGVVSKDPPKSIEEGDAGFPERKLVDIIILAGILPISNVKARPSGQAVRVRDR